jgi:hypothetical protein
MNKQQKAERERRIHEAENQWALALAGCWSGAGTTAGIVACAWPFTLGRILVLRIGPPFG